MRYMIALLLLLVTFVTPAKAQLNLTYLTFQPGQTISSAQFTANFTAISTNALNRTGGTMTGTLTARGITASASNTYDVSGFRDLTITRNASFGSVTISSTAPQFTMFQSDGGTNEKYWILVSDSTLMELRAYNDAASSYTVPLTFTRSGTTVSMATIAATAIGLTGNTTVTGSFGTTGSISYAGDITPGTNNAYDIGSSSFRVKTIYSQNVLNTSDARAKKDVKKTELGLDFILALKPVEFYWRDGDTKTKQYGFIAQDLVKLSFEGVDTSNPKSYSLNYNSLIAPTVKAVQELHEEVHQLMTVVVIQNSKIDFLTARIKELEKGYGEKRSAN